MLFHLPACIQPKTFLRYHCGILCPGFIGSFLFKMKQIIDALLAMRILLQLIGQAAGVALLRKRNGTTQFHYKMPLYPLPVILAM